jgi:hypothetical protein
MNNLAVRVLGEIVAGSLATPLRGHFIAEARIMTVKNRPAAPRRGFSSYLPEPADEELVIRRRELVILSDSEWFVEDAAGHRTDGVGNESSGEWAAGNRS